MIMSRNWRDNFTKPRLKNTFYKMFKVAMMGQFIFLLVTYNKPLYKPKRAETSGYDNYDED